MPSLVGSEMCIRDRFYATLGYLFFFNIASIFVQLYMGQNLPRQLGEVGSCSAHNTYSFPAHMRVWQPGGPQLAVRCHALSCGSLEACCPTLARAKIYSGVDRLLLYSPFGVDWSISYFVTQMGTLWPWSPVHSMKLGTTKSLYVWQAVFRFASPGSRLSSSALLRGMRSTPPHSVKTRGRVCFYIL